MNVVGIRLRDRFNRGSLVNLSVVAPMGRTKGENVCDLPVRDLVLVDSASLVQDEVLARIDETGQLLGRRPLHQSSPRPPRLKARSVRRDNPNALSALPRRSAHLLWSVLLRLRPLRALPPLNGHVPGRGKGLGCEQCPKVMIIIKWCEYFVEVKIRERIRNDC